MFVVMFVHLKIYQNYIYSKNYSTLDCGWKCNFFSKWSASKVLLWFFFWVKAFVSCSAGVWAAVWPAAVLQRHLGPLHPCPRLAGPPTLRLAALRHGRFHRGLRLLWHGWLRAQRSTFTAPHPQLASPMKSTLVGFYYSYLENPVYCQWD